MLEGVVSVPQKKSLSELHKVCTSDTLSRKPACVAAMHRFCIQSTYPTINSYETLGVSREYGNGRIGVSCIRSQLIETVPESTLQQYDGGCTRSKSHRRNCLSAIHRYCIATLDGYQYGGISQEVPSPPNLLIKCFQASHKDLVPQDVLASFNSGCTNSDSDDCFSAASRWCVSLGYSGGITQEVNNDGVVVACYDAEFTNDAFISRSDAFSLPSGKLLKCVVLLSMLTMGFSYLRLLSFSR